MRRRQLVRNVGLAALFSPFLSLLHDSPARAVGGPAKYLFLFVTNGTDSPVWTPTGSTEDRISWSEMNAPLAALQEDLVIVENLDSYGEATEHGSPAGLTGFGLDGRGFDSVDQFASDGLRAAGALTDFPFLHLGGVRTQDPRTFFRNGRGIAAIQSPVDAFNVIFAGATPDDGTAADVLRRRRSTLDLVSGELSALSARLGAEEREKLELHAQSVRDLEDRLRRRVGDIGTPMGMCAPPAPVDALQPLLDAEVDLDLAVHALRCDLTRVVAVRFGHNQTTGIDIPEIGAPGDWHNDLLHGDDPRDRLVALERWLATRFVRAAEALKATPAPDGSGTLFDQTLMVWARDMGDGVLHRGDDMRFVFSGGAGGYLQKSPNGRYLDGRGEHHQRALMSCLSAMGLTDFTGFGVPTVGGDGRLPLPGLAT
ncbi:MAG: DUF1552 domain-containing protein [Deltaproteobacteria bacterium]|nr:DUF1552 domain-containing protein [Deltaproteobacteria bacterium]